MAEDGDHMQMPTRRKGRVDVAHDFKREIND